MTSQEFKEKRIGRINQIQNDELLEEMYRLGSNEDEDADFNVYELSQDQLNAVEEARKQFKMDYSYQVNKQTMRLKNGWANNLNRKTRGPEVFNFIFIKV